MTLLSSQNHMRLLLFFIASLYLTGCNSSTLPSQRIFSFSYPTFHVKIIDQDGHPVEGVEAGIKFGGRPSYTWTNVAWKNYISDSKGMILFKVDGRNITFTKIAKRGYDIDLHKILINYFKSRDFRAIPFGDFGPRDWENNSGENPFIITAWRVGRYPKVNVGEEIFGFNLGELYSMDFTSTDVRRIKHKGDLNLDLQVLIDRDDSGWNVKLKVQNGGLIETDDLYLNLAPESGYQSEFSYSGKKERYVKLVKKYYIHSRGNMYGSLKMDIRPYYRKHSAIDISYVMNLENGQNLAVQQK